VFILGEQCEKERNECEPVNPCLNSGRCIDGFNNFTCICNPGMIRRCRHLFLFSLEKFRNRFYGFLL